MFISFSPHRLDEFLTIARACSREALYTRQFRGCLSTTFLDFRLKSFDLGSCRPTKKTS